MTNFDSVDSPWARVFSEANGLLGLIEFAGLPFVPKRFFGCLLLRETP